VSRAGLLLAIAWLASGACGQSLTAGDGGAHQHRSCGAIAKDYDVALAKSLVCGRYRAPCVVLVPPALVPCPVCPILASDYSVAPLLQEWFDADCPTPSCPPPSCPEYITGLCMPTEDGKAVCVTAVVDGGGTGDVDGGLSDAGANDGGLDDGGSDDCASLAAAYARALPDAQRCDLSADVDACQQEVLLSLDNCTDSCVTFVSDRSVLDDIRLRWIALGCQDVPADCPIQYCPAPLGGMCVPNDGGAPTCRTSYAISPR
jgi:hypothetical protein